MNMVRIGLVGLLMGGVVVAQEQPIAGAELLASANARIEQNRKADISIRVTARDGHAIDHATVRVEQLRHEFLFGCNIFPLFSYQGEQHEKYGQQFAKIFNYATLPFYWGGYEPQPGRKNVADLERLARWCRDHDIVTKGHPLVWHEVYPKWAPTDPDEARAKLEARVTDIVGHYRGLIDRWDVVNEATISSKYDNGVGRWVKRDGPVAVVGQALEWAHAANPKAVLLYNDFNVEPACEELLRGLRKNSVPLDAIGIQSHMHVKDWSFDRAWQVCETFSRFGLPLDFTELTVLSGRYKTDDDWFKRQDNWPTTPEGEARQADYVPKLYTLLFSHPAVEAITWWDFMDGGWQGAPAGLVRADLTPKPAYAKLCELIKTTWWTKAQITTDDQGDGKLRGFRGRYLVTVATPQGEKSQEFDLTKEPKVWRIQLDQ